jgi:hypothetical protein
LAFDNKTTKQAIGGAIGSIQAGLKNVTVKKFAEGSFEADLDDKAIGVILCALFGQLPNSNGATNFTHSFSIKESNVHQSLTLLVQDPNVSAKFALAMLTSFEIKIEPEGKVEYTAEFISKSGVDGVAEVASYSGLGNNFLHSDLALKIAANEAGLPAAVALDVVSLTLKITKNAEEVKLLGSKEVQEIINKDFAVEGSMVLNYTDNNFRDYDLNDSDKTVEIALSKTANNSLVLTIPKATFEGWKPSKGIEDAVTQELTFKGVWPVSTDIFKAVLKNQVSAYVTEESS